MESNVERQSQGNANFYIGSDRDDDYSKKAQSIYIQRLVEEADNSDNPNGLEISLEDFRQLIGKNGKIVELNHQVWHDGIKYRSSLEYSFHKFNCILKDPKLDF